MSFKNAFYVHVTCVRVRVEKCAGRRTEIDGRNFIFVKKDECHMADKRLVYTDFSFNRFNTMKCDFALCYL
ncbi:hypothetical protein DPMN_000232 [Dreissena polymorpha]|uniref:Uncharacterized protein n=1 Tax=Dreissena polymorpha TaxID=45954 RepID=A0A9D4RRW7_DREPO|nr:hypothetical protein DPMN_000232 [Dreissena polymorpha]